MTEPGVHNIHSIDRVVRLFTGMSLIGAVFFIPVPFDYLIMLPLIGIYPCLTGIMGWDPIYHLADIDQAQIGLEFELELNAGRGKSYLATGFA